MQARRRPRVAIQASVGALLLAPLVVIAVACASTDPIDPGAPDNRPQDNSGVCILNNCMSDAECAGCSDGRNSCATSDHRCVACDANTGAGCPSGQYCSQYGNCAPDGVTCPTDMHGVPTISCATSTDCAACDPMHLVCDGATGKCVACTVDDTSECQSTDICVADECSAKCPASCNVDNDCMQCDGAGFKAHACNAHKCSECSATYACPAGENCTAQGVCARICGTDGAGTCLADADCEACGGSATMCHKPINGGPGTCGPGVAGCSDLGNGVVVLPDPWNEVTNTCSNDSDCTGVGIDLNVGKILRDLTGIDGIKDADIQYGMNVCASITTGVNGNSVSCGICVPCREDNDCNDINVDQVALEAFGPLGSVAAAFLLDQVFGQNEHVIHMFCQTVAGDYGVCAPCPGFVYDCGFGGETVSGSTGSCDHDECSVGGPLGSSCDSCSSEICQLDGYCCSNNWDSQCVNEASSYCGLSCGSSFGCAHDECATGASLDASCSTCAAAVCGSDPYCCSNSWDSQCVSEVSQAGCGFTCTSSGPTGGGTDCTSPSQCPWPQGCRPDGSCGYCYDDSDCAPDFCDISTGQCY